MNQQSAATVSMEASVKTEPQKVQEENPVASKKNYQGYWRALFFSVITVAAVLASKVYDFQTMKEFEGIRKGSIGNFFKFGIPVMIIFTILDHACHYFDGWFLEHFINEEKYPDLEKRKKRCYTFAKWGFSIFYYLPISIWAYSILVKTSYMPTWLGGHGTCVGLNRYFVSFDEANDQIMYFYMLQLGKHVSRFFSHVFIRPEGNFYEYALHHALSTYLIFFSYLSNMWLIGIMVLLFHDTTDFILIICRSYRDYKHRKEFVLAIIDFLSFPIWLSGRIFFFSSCCVYSGLKSVYDMPKDDRLTKELVDSMYYPMAFMTLMMVCLQGLQIFWTYYIVSSFLAAQITKKLRHTYD